MVCAIVAQDQGKMTPGSLPLSVTRSGSHWNRIASVSRFIAILIRHISFSILYEMIRKKESLKTQNVAANVCMYVGPLFSLYSSSVNIVDFSTFQRSCGVVFPSSYSSDWSTDFARMSLPYCSSQKPFEVYTANDFSNEQNKTRGMGQRSERNKAIANLFQEQATFNGSSWHPVKRPQLFWSNIKNRPKRLGFQKV